MIFMRGHRGQYHNGSISAAFVGYGECLQGDGGYSNGMPGAFRGRHGFLSVNLLGLECFVRGVDDLWN